MDKEEPKIVIDRLLRDDELRLVREAWEYLRRSPEYRTDHNKLPNPGSAIIFGDDIKAYQKFYQKWNLKYPFNPRLSFDQICRLWRYEHLPFPQRFEQSPPPETWEKIILPERIREQMGFALNFQPPYADAAVVDPKEEIVNGVYLSVWIDLQWPMETILTSRGDKGELKKILDAWMPDWRGKKPPSSKKPIIKEGKREGSLVQLLIICTAPKKKILDEVKTKISELHASWDGERLQVERLHDEVLENRLRVYDMIEGFMCEKQKPKDVAVQLGLSENMVNRYRREALEAIPSKFWHQKENARKQAENYEAAYVPCYLGGCPYPEDGVKRCIAMDYSACPEASDYLNQGLNENLRGLPLKQAERQLAYNSILGSGSKRKGLLQLDFKSDEPTSFFLDKQSSELEGLFKRPRCYDGCEHIPGSERCLGCNQAVKSRYHGTGISKLRGMSKEQSERAYKSIMRCIERESKLPRQDEVDLQEQYLQQNHITVVAPKEGPRGEKRSGGSGDGYKFEGLVSQFTRQSTGRKYEDYLINLLFPDGGEEHRPPTFFPEAQSPQFDGQVLYRSWPDTNLLYD